ncbi:hypothetical protein SAMN05421504_102171 [Amycolatopsis xylanica]|uniref:Uncharacterized protein n=1 Tax=Amycolatopsis xylanica TaxID=589385 RepID=A0A1H2YL35_9PSEU|nr:hypothetical protein [Amycolatopsis xylanica]SDX05790.1 hypothetical protein SAMN05421504_102171 [Amycolatopsis xylanica]
MSTNEPFMAPAPPVPEVEIKRLATGAKIGITLGVVFAFLLSFGVSMLFFRVVSVASAVGTGDCLTLKSGTDGHDYDYRKTSCSRDEAIYRVEARVFPGASCPAGDFLKVKTATDHSEPLSTLCLALNVDTGDCVRNADSETAVERISCAARGAEVRVIVHRYSVEPDLCSSGDHIRVYEGPYERTICLTPVTNA